MSVPPFQGNSLFFDPLAAANASPTRMQASAPGVNSEHPAAGKPRRQGLHVDDEKTLRAASLRKVSRDLDLLRRQRAR